MVSGLFFFLYPKKSNLTSELFTVKDTSKLTKIIISQDTLKVILSKNKTQGTWTVNNKYPANKKSIKKLFQTLSFSKISKPVSSSKTDSVLQSLQNNAKKIEIYNSDNEMIKELKIANYNKYLGGTYMLNSEFNTPFIVNIPGVENDLSYRYNINSSYWMERVIFSYRPNDIKKITLKYPGNLSKSFNLSVFEDSAQIYNLQNKKLLSEIDLHKVGSYLSYFMNVNFSDETFNTKILTKQLKSQKPLAVLIVTDNNNLSRFVKLYKKSNRNEKNGYDLNYLYALINNNDVVIVKYVDFDLILKDINYFANRNK